MRYSKLLFYVFLVLLSGIINSCADSSKTPNKQSNVRLKKVVADYTIDEYIYNAQNKLQAVVHRFPKDSTRITYRQDYSYDQVGQVKEEIWTNGPAATQDNNKRINFEYNSNGQVVREVYFTVGAQPEQYQIDSAFYDAQKRIIKRKIVRKYIIQNTILDYVYNVQNNIETVYNISIAFPNGGKSFRSKTNYTYDGSVNPLHNIVGSVRIEYTNPNNKIKDVSYLTYEMSGDIETQLRSAGPIHEFNYSYQYNGELPVMSMIDNYSITKYVYERY